MFHNPTEAMVTPSSDYYLLKSHDCYTSTSAVVKAPRIARLLWHHRPVDMTSSSGCYGSISSGYYVTFSWLLWYYNRVAMASSTGGYGTIYSLLYDTIIRLLWHDQPIAVATSPGCYVSLPQLTLKDYKLHFRITQSAIYSLICTCL